MEGGGGCIDEGNWLSPDLVVELDHLESILHSGSDLFQLQGD